MLTHTVLITPGLGTVHPVLQPLYRARGTMTFIQAILHCSLWFHSFYVHRILIAANNSELTLPRVCACACVCVCVRVCVCVCACACATVQTGGLVCVPSPGAVQFFSMYCRVVWYRHTEMKSRQERNTGKEHFSPVAR
jgi:hypothetical protein